MREARELLPIDVWDACRLGSGTKVDRDSSGVCGTWLLSPPSDKTGRDDEDRSEWAEGRERVSFLALRIVLRFGWSWDGELAADSESELEELREAEEEDEEDAEEVPAERTRDMSGF